MSDSPVWSDAIKWHDPLCPQYGQEECNHPMTNVKCRHSQIECQCGLIERIRADERDKFGYEYIAMERQYRNRFLEMIKEYPNRTEIPICKVLEIFEGGW